MLRHPASIAAITAALAITPLSANAGLLDSVTSLIPGASSGAGGASFASTATQMSMQLLVGLRSMFNAMQLMHQAVGNKQAAETMSATIKEMATDTQPNDDKVQRWIKTADDNPV